LNGRLIPDLAMKVILSGLLDSSWGNFHRSTIVRLTVYGNYVKIGVGEGNIYQWELDALRDAKIKHDWVIIEDPRIEYVEGIKYIPEKKFSGMPRGLLPVQSREVRIFISDELQMIFPAYRCFDINFGMRRTLSILSPRTLVRDFAQTIHPAFPREKYRGRVDNVEVKAEVLKYLFNRGYGVGILRKRSALMGEMEAFPLLGSEDVAILLSSVE